MNRSFLPAPASTAHAYALIPSADESDFAPQEDSFLSDDLPTKMGFGQSDTEPRVPTPFSRAYLFYFGLGKGSLLPEAAQQIVNGDTGAAAAPAGAEARDRLRSQARAAFRGLCAAFALRELFHLNLELRQAPSLEEAGKTPGASGLYAMLARSLQKDPHRGFWEQPGYYVLTGEGGRSRGVVAGLSPLTGFFPAARGPSTLRQLYWYDPENNRWSDPTETGRRDWVGQDEQMIRTVRGALVEWLKSSLTELDHGTKPLRVAMEQFGMKRPDVEYLAAELRDWRAELLKQPVHLPNPVTVRMTSVRIVPAEVSLRTLRSFPLFELACAADGLEDGVVSKLPMVNGQALVTSRNLLDPHCRLFGNRTGSPAFRGRLATLSAEGENLGRALGLNDDEIPLRYFYLNSLFTPFLTELTVQGFSSEWTGLLLTGTGGVPTGRTFLFPVGLKALGYVARERLAQEVTLREIPDPEVPDRQVFEVTMNVTGQQVTQIYGSKGDPAHRVDPVVRPDLFDLRFFPNFDLSGVPDELLPAPEDRHYAARLRLSPAWREAGAVPSDFVVPLTGNTVTPHGFTDHGNFEDADEQARYWATGMARFLQIEKRPDAFAFRQRGLCLLDLRPAAPPHAQRAEWDVAVDFGTSNTCVAFRNVATQLIPEVLHLPMLTTSLLKTPDYSKMENSHEGHSASLDFFHLDGRGAHLFGADFFPTQICTQRMTAPATGAPITLNDGAVVFQNLSHSVLEEPTIAGLLTNFSGAAAGRSGEMRERPRFALQQDIKWSNAIWMRVFMHHLRHYILLAAARQNANLRNLYFSHPKMFLRHQVQSFGDVLKRVWQPNLQAQRPTQLILRSESEGARSFIAQDHSRDFLVLDIGGGTTDVMAFRGGRPFYQTSFKLAADQVDRYLLASSPLRAVLKQAMLKHGLIDRNYGDLISKLGFTGPMTAGQEVLGRTIWHGLLQHIAQRTDGNGGRQSGGAGEDDPKRFAERVSTLCNVLCHEVYGDPGTDAPTRQAIQGFFLTILLTYGGLAFYGGNVERAMRGEESDAAVPNPIAITFIGNGGRYYHFLEGGEHGFHLAMEAMFQAGAGNAVARPVECVGIFTHDGHQRPKAAIALGMLLEGNNPGGSATLPICNRLGETDFEIGTSRLDPATSNLGDFYRAVLTEDAAAHAGPQTRDPHFKPAENSTFKAFLNRMHELLPAGKHEGHTVVPGLSSGWHDRLLNNQGALLLPGLRARLLANAREYQSHLQDATNTNLPALEPVFISELATLLDMVRKNYAGSAPRS